MSRYERLKEVRNWVIVSSLNFKSSSVAKKHLATEAAVAEQNLHSVAE